MVCGMTISTYIVDIFKIHDSTQDLSKSQLSPSQVDH